MFPPILDPPSSVCGANNTSSNAAISKKESSYFGRIASAVKSGVMSFEAGIAAAFKAPVPLRNWVGVSLSQQKTKPDLFRNKTDQGMELSTMTKNKTESVQVNNGELPEKSSFEAPKALLDNVTKELQEGFLANVQSVEETSNDPTEEPTDITTDAKKDWSRKNFTILENGTEELLEKNVAVVDNKMTTYLEKDFSSHPHFINSVKAMLGQVSPGAFIGGLNTYCESLRNSNDQEEVFSAPLATDCKMSITTMDDPQNIQAGALPKTNQKCVYLKMHDTQKATSQGDKVQFIYSSKGDNLFWLLNNTEKNIAYKANTDATAEVIMRPNQTFDSNKNISKENCPIIFEAASFKSSYQIHE